MSFSPILRVRKFLDKMKTERDSRDSGVAPRLKRFPSRTLSDEVIVQRHSKSDSMDTDSPSSSPFIYPRKYLRVEVQKDEDDEDDRECYFDMLPSEAVLTIFSFLGAKDLTIARLVSKIWCQFADDKSIWKRLCEYEFNFHQTLGETWRETYYRIEDLFSEGVWEGMSKWMEPHGYDNEQKTTARLHFLKRNQSDDSVSQIETKEESNESKEEVPSYKSPMFKIMGSGVTINCSAPSPFKIEGERMISDATGCSFQWNKHFERHTSIYNGKMDFATGTVTGTINYDDGSTHWKGVFFYTRVNNKKQPSTKNKAQQINA